EQHPDRAEARQSQEDPATDRCAGRLGGGARCERGVVVHSSRVRSRRPDGWPRPSSALRAGDRIPGGLASGGDWTTTDRGVGLMATSTTALGIPGFGGGVLTPGAAGYDEAREVFNAMIDRRPAVIAVCTSTDDVVAAVKFARAEGLQISVYGGGHGVTGAAVVDQGLVVDMRGMKDIAVD